MKICSNHRDYQVPLIYTFAFPREEYWCPYCGLLGGFLGTGDNVEETPELVERLKIYHEKAMDFLTTQGRTYAVGTEHNGVQIHPYDLPEEVKRRDAELRESWEYGIKV